MKMMFLAVTFAFFVTAVCFAQQPVNTVKYHDSSKAQNKIATGKIETFTPADPAKGTKNELTLADELGSKVTFTLTAATVIHDADRSIVGLDKLVKNQQIEVKYHTTSAGVNEAARILLLK